MAAYDVSVGTFAVSIGMVGPTLIAHGSPDQQKRHLEPILPARSATGTTG